MDMLSQSRQSHPRIPRTVVLRLALRSATFRLKALSELKSSLMVGNYSDDGSGEIWLMFIKI